jgi:transcriptional regulator with XRE-family HTH domain
VLGDNIRNIRKKQKKTLTEIAAVTGLSVGYLSQLERNMIEPSLSALRKIAKSLDVPVYIFMEENYDNSHILIKIDKRIIMRFPNSSVSYQIMSPMPTQNFNPSVLALAFEIEPYQSDSDDFIVHFSEELIIIEQGEAEIILAKDTYNLKAGDTLFIEKNVPHKIINNRSIPLKGTLILSPPVYPNHK